MLLVRLFEKLGFVAAHVFGEFEKHFFRNGLSGVVAFFKNPKKFEKADCARCERDGLYHDRRERMLRELKKRFEILYDEFQLLHAVDECVAFFI